MPLLILAHEMASVAGELQTAIEIANGPRIRELGPPPPADVWERLYRRGDRLFERLGNSLLLPICDHADLSGIGTFARSLAVSVRGLRRSTPELVRLALSELQASEDWKRQWALALEAMNEGWAAHLEELRRGAEPVVPEDAKMQTPEVQFFFRVWWPCWALYGQSANTLFTRAVSGDVQAFEKLARIDARFLSIPRVVDQWERWKLQGQTDACRLVGQAVAAKPLTTTIKAQKLRTIAQLFRLSRQFAACPLGSIVLLQLDDLRDLFDAAARDQGKLVDEDLPKANETFRKAIMRAQKDQSVEAWDMVCRKRVP